MSTHSRAILCFGDSNTHGTCPMKGPGDTRRHPATTRWPGRMAALLGEGFSVIEEGHPGRTTLHDDPVEGAHKNGLSVLPAILESHRPLDLVILMLGTNDLKARFSVPAGDIARSAERLITVIEASECGPERGAPDLLLIAPVPVLETGWLAEIFAGGAEKSRRLAGSYADIAARYGAGFLEAGGVVAVDPLDGIHLDAASHLALGAAVADMVAARSG